MASSSLSLDLIDVGTGIVGDNLISTVLEKLSFGLSSSSVIDQLSDYIFLNDVIAAYNGHLCAIHKRPPVLADVPDCTVKGSRLYKLLSFFDSNDDCACKVEGNQLIFQSAKTSFGLVYNSDLSAIKAMVEDVQSDIAKNNWVTIPEGFVDGLKLCSFYASKDMSRTDLTGVCVAGDRLLSSDGYRISAYELSNAVGEFVLPANICALLPDTELAEFAVGDVWVHFRSADGAYTVSIKKIMSADYPVETVLDFFPSDKVCEKAATIVLPKDVLSLIDKVKVLLQGMFILDQEMILQFEKIGRLTCTAKRRGVGWIEESIELPCSVSFVVGVNPLFLQQILRYTAKAVYLSSDKMLFASGPFRQLMALISVE